MLPVIVMLLAGAFMAASAAEPFYLGTWKIASAVPAPWADPKFPPDASESRSLAGKIVTFKANEITGPRLMDCKHPHYRVVEAPAEGLFQGAFEEMHRRDSSADPLKLAEKLGFRGKSWQSLQTGCANELDFHFVDSRTAEFGLNDYVYTMKKQ